MINTKQWADLLNRQYSLVSNSGGGLDLLLAVRKFVVFLDSDPHARRYIKDLDYKWDEAHKKWHNNRHEMRVQLSEVEQEIRALAPKLDATIKNLEKIPDAARGSIHILDKIREVDWYQSWANTSDVFDLELLHIDRSPLITQTGHMISHVLGITRQLAKLAEGVKAEQETTVELKVRAEGLWQQCNSARRKLKYDWMSSGKHALEQLRIVVRIIDGDVFVDPAHYKFPKSRSLAPWTTLVLGHAPPDLRREVECSLTYIETEYKDFEQDLDPLIRLHLRRVFEELQALADSRLAHQHLVERYKVRCENYDRKNIEKLIKDYVQAAKRYYLFEDLLTLHFARYLYDNGYAVHYKLKAGRQEPDLLVSSSDLELEPIVVEAKIIGQEHGTPRKRSWIIEGLNSLHSYLEKFHSDYGVTDGYLVAFRIGDKSPVYTFDPQEWVLGHFIIVPKLINLGGTGKEAPHEVISKEDWIKGLES